MLRMIGSIIVGYIVMAIVVIITNMIAVQMLPSYQTTPTTAYMIVSIVLGFGAALVGGHVTAMIAKEDGLKAVNGLVGLVIVLGILSIIAPVDSQPLWYLVAVVIVGAAGVYLGGKQYLSHKK